MDFKEALSPRSQMIMDEAQEVNSEICALAGSKHLPADTKDWAQPLSKRLAGVPDRRQKLNAEDSGGVMERATLTKLVRDLYTLQECMEELERSATGMCLCFALKRAKAEFQKKIPASRRRIKEFVVNAEAITKKSYTGQAVDKVTNFLTQELWVDCVGANKSETKYAKFYPKMLKFFEVNFASAFGPSAPLWADLKPDVVQANVRTHIVPDHLEATDTVRMELVDKAFQLGCDMQVNMMNYCRRAVKKYENKIEEHDEIAGEEDAKDLCNDSIEGCMQVLGTYGEHEFLALYALRCIPRHCQTSAAKQIVIGEGHGVALLAATMRKHEENVNVQDGCLSVLNKIMETAQVLPVLGLLITSGCKEILLAMRKFKFAANLQFNGCQLLAGVGLCESRDDIPQRFRDAAVSVCASVLKVHGEKVDHVEEACNAIGAMYNGDVANAVDMGVVTTRVLAAMEVNPLRAIMQKSISNCLRRMCGATTLCKKTYLENNGINLSLQMVARHPALVGFHCDTWNLFEILMEDEETKQLLIDVGGISEVLVSMGYHFAHRGTQAVCARICASLAEELPGSANVWEWEEVIRLGLESVELHVNDEGICTNMATVFKNVLYHDEERYGHHFIGEEPKSVERIMSCMTTYDENDVLTQSGYQVYWKLSNLFDEFHEPFFRLNGDEHLPKVMFRYSDDVAQLEPTTGVLRNLLSCPEFPTATKYQCLAVLLKKMVTTLDNQGYVEEVCGVLSVLSASNSTNTSNDMKSKLGPDSLTDADIVGLLIGVLGALKDPNGPQAATLLALNNIIAAGGGVTGDILEVLKQKDCLSVIFETLRMCKRAQGTQIVGIEVISVVCQHSEVCDMMPPAEVIIPVFKNCYDNLRFVENTQCGLCKILVKIHSNRNLKAQWKAMMAANLTVLHLRSQSMHQGSVAYQALAMDVLVRCTSLAPVKYAPLICKMIHKYYLDETVQTLGWKIVALWSRIPEFQPVLVEKVFGLAPDRMDSFMGNGEYIIAISTAMLRLATTEILMSNLAERGVMMTSIKIVEHKSDEGGVMFAVFSLLGGMLSVPSVSVEGNHFRFVEAASKAMAAHPKNIKLQAAMSGPIYCVQDRFKFSEWAYAHLSTPALIKCLEATKVEPDISEEQRLSLQQSVSCALSVLSRRPEDHKELLKDDCKGMSLVVQPLRDCIKHEATFPDRIKYDDLQLNCWLIITRVGESTDFSANPGFNKVPSELGPVMLLRHKLVSDLQLAIMACLYNSEAIKFEPEDKATPASDAIAEGVLGKGKLNGLQSAKGIKGKSLLGGFKKNSKWSVIRQVAKKNRDTRLLRTKEENAEIKQCANQILLNHQTCPDLLVAVWGVWHRLFPPEDYRFQVFKEGTAAIAMKAMFESNRWWYTHHLKTWIREEALLGLRFIFIERDLKKMNDMELDNLVLAVLDSMGDEYHTDSSLIEVAHGTLMALSEFAVLKPRMIKFGGVKLLGQAMKFDSSEIHWHAVSTLLNLCDTVDQVQDVDCSQVLRVIVRYSNALSTCKMSLAEAMAGQRLTPAVDRVALLTKLCQLSARMMLNEDNKHMLCENGIVDRLLYLMLQNRQSPKLIEECVSVMRSAASYMAEVFNDNNQEEAVLALEAAIEDWPDNTRTHVSSLACLRYILPVADYRLYAIKNSDIRSILKTLLMDRGETELEKTDYFDLQIESLAIFQELVMSADARGSLIQHGLKIILSKMLEFKDDHRIQLEGCIMLERLALYPEALGADWADDAIQVLVQAVQTHVHHSMLREEAITAILYLTRTDDNRVSMKRNYGDRTLALMLAQCTRDHPDRPRLCVNAWGLVAEMNRGFFENLVVEQFPHGVGVAVDMLLNPPLELIGPLESGMGELQSAACDVLSALLPVNECLEFGELDIVGAVVGAMRGLVMHEELQSKGSVVLGLAGTSETAMNLLLRAPSIGTIVNGMDTWPQSEDVCRDGFRALASIGAWQIAKRQILHEGVFENFRNWASCHGESEDVCAPASVLISNVVDDEVVCQEVVEKGLGSFVLTALCHFSENVEILTATSIVAESSTLRPILQAANAVEEVGRMARAAVGTELEADYNDLLNKLTIY